MESLAKKRIGLLTDPCSSSLPMVPAKESWAQCRVVKYHFWDAADKLPLSAPPPVDRTDKEDHPHYLTLFDDHPEEMAS